MKKRLPYFILTSVLVILAAYKLYEFNRHLNNMGECGYDLGPIYGNTIELNTSDLKIEHKIEIPNGKLGFINISDSLSPKILKLNSNDNIEWTFEFRESEDIEIEHQEWSNIQLQNSKQGITISFFNDSHSEPGIIYLDNEYNFKYICLKMF